MTINQIKKYFYKKMIGENCCEGNQRNCNIHAINCKTKTVIALYVGGNVAMQ